MHRVIYSALVCALVWQSTSRQLMQRANIFAIVGPVTRDKASYA